MPAPSCLRILPTMAWFWQRKSLRSGPASHAAANAGGPASLSPATTARALAAAGWRPDRVVDPGPMAESLRRAGFTLHQAAKEFLSRYGGLQLSVPVAGADGLEGFVQFGPAPVLPFWDPAEDLASLSALVREPACLIGSVSGHTFFLLMGEDGRTYLLDRGWDLFAPLADDAQSMLEVLCDGRNGRVDSVVLVDRQPGGRLYGVEDERPNWGLHEFPGIIDLLPARSLEPGRRPPTFHALPRLMQRHATTVKGGTQSVRQSLQGLFFSSGGFTFAANGQGYFVAHTENSLEIRRTVPLTVSGLPPDLGVTSVRPGESIPYTPPAHWQRSTKS